MQLSKSYWLQPHSDLHYHYNLWLLPQLTQSDCHQSHHNPCTLTSNISDFQPYCNSNITHWAAVILWNSLFHWFHLMMTQAVMGDPWDTSLTSSPLTGTCLVYCDIMSISVFAWAWWLYDVYYVLCTSVVLTMHNRWYTVRSHPPMSMLLPPVLLQHTRQSAKDHLYRVGSIIPTI